MSGLSSSGRLVIRQRLARRGRDNTPPHPFVPLRSFPNTLDEISLSTFAPASVRGSPFTH